MQPKIINLKEKKLAGLRLTMSLANNKTGELWKSFIPISREIKNRLSNDFISMQVYAHDLMADFDPNQEFDKWATVEVTGFDNLPDRLEPFILPGGTYAVFEYKGSGNDNTIFQYIFGTWLPESDFVLDNRPHFEVLGEKYKNADPDSEEEIWIPIRLK